MLRPRFIRVLAALVLVIGAAIAVPALAQHHTREGVYVGDLSPGDDGAAPYECGTQDNPCDSIEHGVVHAAAGETLLLANGVMREAPLTIDKDLSIEGARGPVKTILKPATDVEPGEAWFVVRPAVNVEWTMVRFEGSGHQVSQAIRFEGAGQVADSVFKKLTTSGPGGAAVAAVGEDVTVYKSEFSEIGHTSVLISGAGQSSAVLGSRLTGTGAGAGEQYGVEVEGGAQASILDNTFSGYAGAGEGGRSAAVAARGAAPGTEVEVVANDVRSSEVGLAVDGAAGPASVKARANGFVGNVAGVAASGATVEALDDWWGCNEGPAGAGCDPVEGSVQAPTWLTLSVAASPATLSVAGTSTITATLTRNSAGREVPVPSLQPIEELESERGNPEEGVGATGFADDTSIAFSATGGYLASPVSTVAGSASSTLTAVGPPGQATVRASLDSAAAVAQLTVEPEGASSAGPQNTAPSRQAPQPPTSSGRRGGEGTRGNDHLYGSRRADSLEGFAGNDLLVGRRGQDLLSGGRGDDALFGGRGGDLLLGGPGEDILNGGLGNDLLAGSTGADLLFGGRGRDVLLGGRGNDRLRAADGLPGDVLVCGPGFDLAIADRSDRVGKSCERVVRRSPAPFRAGNEGNSSK